MKTDKWTAKETRVYLPNNAGGFDVRHCPDAQDLASKIALAMNNHESLLAACKIAAEFFATIDRTPGEANARAHCLAAIANTES